MRVCISKQGRFLTEGGGHTNVAYNIQTLAVMSTLSIGTTEFMRETSGRGGGQFACHFTFSPGNRLCIQVVLEFKKKKKIRVKLYKIRTISVCYRLQCFLIRVIPYLFNTATAFFYKNLNISHAAQTHRYITLTVFCFFFYEMCKHLFNYNSL